MRAQLARYACHITRPSRTRPLEINLTIKQQKQALTRRTPIQLLIVLSAKRLVFAAILHHSIRGHLPHYQINLLITIFLWSVCGSSFFQRKCTLYQNPLQLYSRCLIASWDNSPRFFRNLCCVGFLLSFRSC
jgi:hypothetical protein